MGQKIRASIREPASRQKDKRKYEYATGHTDRTRILAEYRRTRLPRAPVTPIALPERPGGVSGRRTCACGAGSGAWLQKIAVVGSFSPFRAWTTRHVATCRANDPGFRLNESRRAERTGSTVSPRNPPAAKQLLIWCVDRGGGLKEGFVVKSVVVF